MRNALSLENLTGIFRVSSKEPSRIINREGTTIEFKESYNHGNMAQYFKAMAAFANNQGGYILFGIGDKPRRLIGLKDKSLSQFEELKVEDFTKALLDYFSPEIKWEHCTFEFHGMSFGVIYVYPLLHKPCICKKHYDAQNAKYSLKEGDIYYRYGGRSERIRYTELASIIDEARKNEERQWLNFAKRAVRIGVSNAALLDLKSGNLSGTNGSVVIDSELLQKLAFIQEALHKGKFLTKQLDNARCGAAHVVSKKAAVRPRISKEPLFIKGLCKVKGLLRGVAENAVRFPLQRGKVKELRRGCGFLLSGEGNAYRRLCFASPFQRGGFCLV